jgi:hypothetical protein
MTKMIGPSKYLSTLNVAGYTVSFDPCNPDDVEWRYQLFIRRDIVWC